MHNIVDNDARNEALWDLLRFAQTDSDACLYNVYVAVSALCIYIVELGPDWIQKEMERKKNRWLDIIDGWAESVDANEYTQHKRYAHFAMGCIISHAIN